MSKDSRTSGRFIWHELVTSDPKGVFGFYGELLGWTATERDMGAMGKYTVFKAGGVDVGGATTPPPGVKVPPSWLAYCSVPDVDAAIRTAVEHGGSAMSPAIDIPGVGRFAVLLDAQGAALAPMTPPTDRPEAEGPPAVGSFCWDELHTKDPASALAFYRAVYGFTVEDKDMGPMGTYHMLKRGDRQTAGVVRTRMAEQPSAWLAYVAVPDVDLGAKRAEALHGKVIVPPGDIPGIGRFSVIADPNGAVLALFKGVPGGSM